MGWDPQLEDRRSQLFLLLAQELEETFTNIFQSTDPLTVKVTEFRQGQSYVW